MIRAGARHRPAIEAALGRRPELAMFPLSNLARHGMAGGHPRAMTFWLDHADPPTAILGLTEEGMALPFAPGGADGAAMADVLRDRPLIGFAGEAATVRAVMAAMELSDRTARLDEDEPQFALSLDALAVRDGAGTLAPLTMDPDLAARWRRAYDDELRVGADTETAARAEIDGWIEADSHRFLMIDGEPVALTGFNAALPDIVQVGGVYVPPAARNRGLARRAVALHLAEARDAGVRTATLFAASPAAVACYAPLGFARIGDYALVFLDPAVAP